MRKLTAQTRHASYCYFRLIKKAKNLLLYEFPVLLFAQQNLISTSFLEDDLRIPLTILNQQLSYFLHFESEHENYKHKTTGKVLIYNT